MDHPSGTNPVVRGPPSQSRDAAPDPVQTSASGGLPFPARGCSPHPQSPPGTPASRPNPPLPALRAAVPRLMTARPARAAAARSRSRAPGAGGGIAAAAARRGRGRGGRSGAREAWGERGRGRGTPPAAAPARGAAGAGGGGWGGATRRPELLQTRGGGRRRRAGRQTNQNRRGAGEAGPRGVACGRERPLLLRPGPYPLLPRSPESRVWDLSRAHLPPASGPNVILPQIQETCP